MPRNFIPADKFAFDRASLLAYHSASSSEDKSKKQKMLSIAMKAMDKELTETQRFCIVEHYINGRKMKDIAASLSVNPSTVTRHIQRAKRKLQNIASYYS